MPRPRSSPPTSSCRRTDVGGKLQRYRDAGTRELWLVDTPASTVLIYRAGSFGEPTEGGPGEQLTSPLWPRVRAHLNELFAR